MNKNKILQTLKQHKSYITENFSVTKIGLFGSYAKDKQKPDSDIDFYVEFEHKSFDNLAGLWVYLEELYHNKIDIIHKHKGSNKIIIKKIQEEVVYG